MSNPHPIRQPGFEAHPEWIEKGHKARKIPKELKEKCIENKRKLLEIYEKWTFIPYDEFVAIKADLKKKEDFQKQFENQPRKLKEALVGNKSVGLSTLDVYVIRLLSKGMVQGDGRLDVLLNRIYGKPKESMEITGSGGKGLFEPIYPVDLNAEDIEHLKEQMKILKGK